MTTEKPKEVVSASMDTELGRIVVEQSLATQGEVNECIALQAQEADNNQQSLSEMLVSKGFVTDGQISRTKSRIEEARKGQQIPGYEIICKIGAGAMATVFKAKQVSLDRLVAIKVLPRRLSDNIEYVERFYMEGQAAAKLNHHNIVQAFDVGEAGGYHYFVMEYVEGHSLYEELAEGKIFTEAEALKVIIMIAKALEHAHAQGLIHRDVKPKNIMMTPDRIAKLADMGLARVASDEEVAQAEAGRAFGTPYYISPEQIRGEVNIDFRADIYSLGATLYHLVTGKVPFEGDTPAAVMHKHLKEALVPPDHLNMDLSVGLGEIVEVMMAKDRTHRYESTTDLLVDLESVATGDAPMLARRQIDADMLSSLAEGEEQAEIHDQTDIIYTADTGMNLKVVIFLLSVALTASVAVVLLLLLTGAGK